MGNDWKFGRRVETLPSTPGLQGREGKEGLQGVAAEIEEPAKTGVASPTFKKPIERPTGVDPGIVQEQEIDPTFEDRYADLQQQPRHAADPGDDPDRPGITPVTARIFDPRKIRHRQLQDINRPLIDQLNREDRETARQQETIARESKARRGKAVTALEKQLKEHEERRIFDAERDLDDKGIEYTTSFKGYPVIKKDSKGRPVYKKKEGEIEFDKDGNARRLNRLSTGEVEWEDLDEDNPWKEDPTLKDGILRQKSKYRPDKTVDPAEGRFSGDRRIAVASSQMIHRLEEERLTRLLKDTNLYPKGPSDTEREKLEEQKASLEADIANPDESYDEHRPQLRKDIEEIKRELAEGLERQGLEREMELLLSRGSAAFMKPGSLLPGQEPKRMSVGGAAGAILEAIGTYDSEEKISEDAKALNEEFYADRKEIEDDFQDIIAPPKDAVTADESKEIEAERRTKKERLVADIKHKAKTKGKIYQDEAEIIAERTATLKTTREKEAAQEKEEYREGLSTLGKDSLFTGLADQYLTDLDELNSREKAIKALEPGGEKDATVQAFNNEIKARGEQFKADIEAKHGQKIEIWKEIEDYKKGFTARLTQEALASSVGAYGGAGSGVDAWYRKRREDMWKEVENLLEGKEGFTTEEIQSIISDFKLVESVNGPQGFLAKEVPGAVRLSNGAVAVDPTLLWKDDEALAAVDKVLPPGKEGDSERIAARERVKEQQIAMAPAILTAINETAFKEDWDEFSAKYIESFKAAHDGQVPTQTQQLVQFRKDHADLWDNIEWKKFLYSLGQMTSWVGSVSTKVTGVDQLLRASGAPNIYNEWGSSLDKEIQALTTMGQFMDDKEILWGFTKSDILGGAYSLVPSMVPGMAVGMVGVRVGMTGAAASRAAYLTSTVAAGIQSAAPTLYSAAEGLTSSIYNKLIDEEGVPLEEISQERQGELHSMAEKRAWNQAFWISLGAGTITAAVMAGSAKVFGGPKGVERLLLRGTGGGLTSARELVRSISIKNLRKTFTSKAFYKALAKSAGSFGVNAGEEFLEEFSDQLLNGILEANTYSPDKSISEIFAEAWKAGLMGFLLGGGTNIAGGGMTGANESWKQWRESVKDRKSSLERIQGAIDAQEDPEIDLDPMDLMAAAEGEIDAWAPKGLNPVTISLDQRIAKAAGRIAIGDVDSVSDADLAMLGLKRGKDGTLEQGKVAPGKAPRATVQNGVPVLSQALIDELSARHPTLAKILPKTEAEQRAGTIGEPGEPGKPGEPGAAPEPAPEPEAAPEATPEAEGERTFSVPVTIYEEGKVARLEPIEVQALDAEHAARLVADMGVGDVQMSGIREVAPAPAPASPTQEEIEKKASSTLKSKLIAEAEALGIGLEGISRGREGKKQLAERILKAASRPVAEPMPVITPEQETAVAEAIAQIEAKHGPLSVDARVGIRKAAIAVAAVMEKWKNVFKGVGWTAGKQGTGGMFLDGDTLNFSVADILVTLAREDVDPGTWAEKAGLEEAIHLVAKQLAAAGEINVEAIWDAMPEGLKQAVRGVYLGVDPKNESYVLGHEFLRMLVQGRMALGKDGQWTVDGEVVSTEESSPGFIEMIRDAFTKLLEFFNTALDSDAEYAVEIRKAVDLIANRLQSLQAGIEPTPVAPAPEVAPEAVPAPEPTARGPPTTEIDQFEEWKKGKFKKGEDLRDPHTGKMKRRIGTARGMRIITVPEAKAATEPLTPSPAPGPPRTPDKIAGEMFLEGGDAQVVRSDGSVVNVRYMVAPAYHARPSHDALGRETAQYPQELQPRDRSTPQYRKQAQNIARNLSFDQAAFFPGTQTPTTTSDIGPPILAPEGQFESTGHHNTLIGNGREIGIVESYRQKHPASEQYRQDLIAHAEKFGLDPEEVAQWPDPILYRYITDDMSLEELKDFSRESNEGEAMVTSAVELAGVDADKLTPQILQGLDPEFAIDSKRNEDFRTNYVQQVIGARSANEANITPSDLKKRISMGIFTAAYGLDAEGRAALDRMSDDAGDDAKRLTNALMTVAPMVARMRQDIASGRLNDLDVSTEIAGAVQRISVALRESKNVTAAWEALSGQGELGLEGRTLEGDILGFLVENKGDRRSLENAISNYAESVYQVGDPTQAEIFERETLPTKEELWENATKPEAVQKPESETILAAQPLNKALRAKKVDEKRALNAEVKRHEDAGIEVKPHKRVLLEAVQKLPQPVRDHLFSLAVEANKVADSRVNSLPKKIREGIAAIERARLKERTLSREDYEDQWIEHLKRFVDSEKGIDFNKELQAELKRLADENNGLPQPGPIKNDRAIDKAIDKAEEKTEDFREDHPGKEKIFEPDFNDVNDIIRGSLIVTTNAEVDAMVDAVYDNPNWKIVKNAKGELPSDARKNRLMHKDRFRNPLGEYKDHLLLVELAPGVIAEVQVHRADIYYAKEIGPGHRFYGTTRQIIESKIHKKTATGKTDSPLVREANDRFRKLNDISNGYYKDSSDSYEDGTGDHYEPRLGTQALSSAAALALRSARTRRASSLDISEAPERMVPISRARSASDLGTVVSPTILRKPGPISQGIPASERTNFRTSFSSLAPITPIDTPIRLSAQELDLFNDYSKTLPARTKASKPVFKRKVKKDLPSASLKTVETLFDWANGNLDAETDSRDDTGRTEGDLGLGEGVGSLEPGGTPVSVEQPTDSRPEDEDAVERLEGRGRLDGDRAEDIAGTGVRGREAPVGEGAEAVREDGSRRGEDVGGVGREEIAPIDRPGVNTPERNHTIASQEELNPSGQKARIRANLTALELLRTLEDEDRDATSEEKATLVKFSGWGAVGQLFDRIRIKQVDEGRIEQLRESAKRDEKTARTYSHNPQYASMYLESAQKETKQADKLDNWKKQWGEDARIIRDLLSEEEWDAAARSITNGHFTSLEVVKGMWDAVERMGFNGGVALEPAGGIGHFLGGMPGNLSDRTKTVGVELDSVTGRIFGKLYPETDVFVKGYEDAPIEPGAADLVISNVPFENTFTIDDSSLAGAPKFNLHNYFFAKALQSAKPGGLVAFITTHHTMDSSGDQRRWLAKHGELVGAVRLPNTTFKANAGTQVTTDIIFLRKPDGKEFKGESWTETEELSFPGRGPIHVNEYFTRNPDMVLGRMSNDGTMRARFQPEEGEESPGETTVHPTGELSEQLAEAVSRLPANVMGEGARTGKVGKVEDAKTATRKTGSIYLDGQDVKVQGGTQAKLPKRPVILSFIKVKDALNGLLAAERNPDTKDSDLREMRETLNRVYDAHVRSHGNFHKKAARDLSIDPDYYRVLGLEIADGESNFKKASIFSERVMNPVAEPTSAENASDAVSHSLSWRGRVDVDFMAELLGEPQEKVLADFIGSGLGFVNPATGLPEIRNHYLSGNVRTKLTQARKAAEASDKFNPNVEALEAVQPEDLEFKDVSFYLGSAWIPPTIIDRFAHERVGVGVKSSYLRSEAVNEMASEKWILEPSTKSKRGRTEFESGVRGFPAAKILESLLNIRNPVIKKNVGTKKAPQYVVDAKATADVRAAQERMKEAFIEWVSNNEGAQSEITQEYNDRFNNYIDGKYDGQHMVLPWINPKFDLYPSKKDVVFRAIQERRGLIAHGVGGGKTVIATAIAMEMKRLGLANKPMIAVHNATLEQFSETVREMAPEANILVARNKDLAGPKRKEFYGKIAAGDWDVIIIAHSSLNMIPDDAKYEAKILNEVRDQLVGSIERAAYQEGKDSSTAKEVEKQIKKIDAKLEKLKNRKVDDVLTFQEMGIDALILDEAHLYKKLPFATKLSNNVVGVERGASQRATSFLTKSRFIQEQQDGKNVFTMTGTPVTNTLGETWNMIRMVAPDLLADFDVSTFDSFATTFAEVETRDELRPNGKFKRIQRLSKITNLPEWNKLFRHIADVKLGKAMDVKNRPEIEGGEAKLFSVPQSLGMANFKEDVVFPAIDRFDKLSGKEKKEFSYIPLVTFGAAKAAAIDIRLVDPNGKDEPGSKLNTMIRGALELYEKHGDNKGTQVIFSDTIRSVKREKLDDFLKGRTITQELDEDPETEDEELEAGEFNLYEEIRTKLVAGGVAESEIASIQDYKTPEAKRKLFEKINSGDVRFVIGSTQKLGTGVNMQERMIAAHHLDVPWTPADLEQRDGRVYRQGNIFGKLGIPIQLNRYGMEESLDAALWDKLGFKERFIRQAMSGEVSSRAIEEDEGLLSLSEQKAVLMGAEGLRFFQISQEIEGLVGDRRAHEDLRERSRRELSQSLDAIELAKVRLEKLEAGLTELGDSWTGDMAFTLKTPGRTITDIKDVKDAFQAAFDARIAQINGQSLPKGEVQALQKLRENDALSEPIGGISIDGVEIELRHDRFKVMTQGKNRFTVEFIPVIKLPSGAELKLGKVSSAATLETRIRGARESLDIERISQERLIDREQREVVISSEMSERPFSREQSLQDLIVEYREIGPQFDADMSIVDAIAPRPKHDFAPQEGETAKELRERIKESYPAPEQLVPDTDLYFDESLADPGNKVLRVPVGNLRTTRARAGGIANAEKFMAASAEGIMPKRGPVNLRDNGDGTFLVLDGNSTTAIAQKHGFEDVIGQIVEEAQKVEGLKSELKKMGKMTLLGRDIRSEEERLGTQPLQGTISQKKGEAVLFKPTGKLLEEIKSARDTAMKTWEGLPSHLRATISLADAADMVALEDKDIHITLVGQAVNEAHPVKAKAKTEPRISFDFPQYATEKRADGTIKKSIFIRIKEQDELTSFVQGAIGEPTPDVDREYHVTLATTDGDARSAVSYPEESSPRVGSWTNPRISEEYRPRTNIEVLNRGINRLHRKLAKDPVKNREQLQRLVDKSAEDAGAMTNLPGQGAHKVWRGDSDAFTEFKREMRGTATFQQRSKQGFFFTDSENDARGFARHGATGKGPIYGVSRQFYLFAPNGILRNTNMTGSLLEDLSPFLKEKGTILKLHGRRDSVESSVTQADVMIDGRRMYIDRETDFIEEIEKIKAGEADPYWKVEMIEAFEETIREEQENVDVLAEIPDGGVEDAALGLKNWKAILDAVKKGELDRISIYRPDPVAVYVVEEPKQIKSADPVTRDEQGNIIPLTERWDLTDPSTLKSQDLDARYLKLANNPEANQAELQEMVDKAAKNAGYDIGPVFHGSHSNFTVPKGNRGVTATVSLDRITAEWFSKAMHEEASYYAEQGEEFPNLSDEPVVYRWKLKGEYFNPESKEHFERVLKANPSLDIKNNKFSWEDYEMGWEGGRSELQNAIRSAGFDGYYERIEDASDEGIGGFKNISIFSPSNIKSADPVTYDDAGNVIPLSQRFDPTDPSILKSQDLDATSPTIDLGRDFDNVAELYEYLLDDRNIGDEVLESANQQAWDHFFPGRDPSSPWASSLTGDDAINQYLEKVSEFYLAADKLLYSQSLSTMTGKTDIDRAIEKLYGEALNERAGERTIGNPDLAMGAEDPVIMSVDEYRKTNVPAESFEQWNAAARAMLENDYPGTAETVMSLGFEGGMLDPIQSRAAQMIVAEEMTKPITRERREYIQKLVWAYRATGTEQARGLAARRDPFKTPAERHSEFLGKIIFTPPRGVRKQLSKATTREEVEELLREDRIRIERIEKELAKTGVSLDDIFRGEVELTLKGARILKNITESYSEKQQAAFALIQQQKPWKEIAKEVGLKKSEVIQVRNAFEEEFRRRHFEKFEKGMMPEDIDLGVEELPLGTQDISPEIAEQRFQEALRMMGVVPENRQGKMKTRIRKPKKKLFKPPPAMDAEAQAAWEKFAGRDFEPDVEEREQEYLIPFDLDDAIQVVKVARLAQAATGSNGFDMVYEYWINNILSGPQTQLVNIAGNTANAGWDFTFQRGMEVLINTVVRDEKGARMGEMAHLVKGILPGMARAYRLSMVAWDTETDWFKADVLGENVILSEGYIKGEKILPAIRGKKGRVIRMAGRGLLFADSFFKGLFGTMEAGAQAYRIAKTEGLKGKELEARIAELVAEPNSQAWQVAVDKAVDLAFQTPLKSWEEGGGAAESLVHWVSKGKSSVPILRWIIPFIRTSFNILRQGVRKSPLGTINFTHHFIRNGLFKMKNGKPVVENYPNLVRDLAEQTLAWGATALLYGAAEGDADDDEKFFLITGSRPPRRGESDLKRRETGGDYMIRIGDVTIPYGRIEPFATVLGTSVDIVRVIKSKDTLGKSMEQFYGWMLAQAKNKTFIKGLGDIARVMESPERAGDYSKRFVLQALVPNLIRQPLRNIDPLEREWKTKEAWSDILPLQSGAEPKIDPVTGKPIEKAGTALSRIFVPSFRKPTKLSGHEKLLANWNRMHPSLSWGPTPVKRTLNLGAARDNENVDLGRKSYRFLAVRAATVTQRELKKLNLRGYQIANPKEEDLEQIKKAYTKGRADANAFLRKRTVEQLKK